MESARMSAEPWVAVEDVARHLGVSHDTVYRWIDGKGLPAHKLGRLWKFKLSEVDDWVRAGGAQDNNDGAKGAR
jgi:excisionase family DNA binding protein